MNFKRLFAAILKKHLIPASDRIGSEVAIRSIRFLRRVPSWNVQGRNRLEILRKLFQTGLKHFMLLTESARAREPNAGRLSETQHRPMRSHHSSLLD